MTGVIIEATLYPIDIVKSRLQKNPSNVVNTGQGQLVLPRKGVEEGKGNLSTWRFDREACRKGLAQMIVINELPFNHKGESIGMVIEKCLLNWGIDKLFTVTVDNASSNNVVSGYLRKKFNPRRGLVQNGLKEIKKSVERVRRAVRYVRQSPARLQKFKECVVVER
ncbi:hypothetical protein PVK06_010760 [Gossypium arboreum]|uniref:Uncharacterized protein n=1 Tax=Gossypium arboreum TaxID=29729 RepID=A0ABR0Q6W9_GOSAR|nr:hypothetical protein PVK06_010760 [Gossypium arboreum]